MPVPKRKRSRARRDKRFANKAMKIQAITACANCQAALATHTACKQCGFYKGVKIMTGTVERQAKRSQAKKAKETSQQAAIEAASSKDSEGQE